MSLYSSQTISGYNSSPPSDDGAAESQNQATWAGVKTKLGDPVKTLAEAINAELLADFNTNINTTRATLTFWDVTGVYSEVPGTQTISSGAYDKIDFGTNEVDPGGNFSGDTYTVPQTGYYLITFRWGGVLSTALTVSEGVALRVVQGASSTRLQNYMGERGASVTNNTDSISGIVNLTAAQTVSIQMFHNHTADAIPIDSGWVTIVRIA